MFYPVIFIIYLILFCYLLVLIFHKIQNWKDYLLLLIPFFVKIGAGILYGIYYSNQENADTWTYFNGGLTVLDSFKKEGLITFTLLIPNKGHDFSFISGSSYFEYYRYAVMDWISAFFSLLSGKNYYTNLIFYNFLIYIGLIKLYRFLIQIKPDYSRIFYFLLFFFPPFIFWTSGFHRDGICVAILGFGLYYLKSLLETKRLKFALPVTATIFLLFFFRSFWGVSFVSVACLWRFGKSQRKHAQQAILFGLIILTGLFFASTILPTGLNLPLNLAEKQAGFLKLVGSSRMSLERLRQSPLSYFYPAIQGMNHLLLRPYPNEILGSFLYTFAFIENLVVWGLFACIIIAWQKGKAVNPFKNTENCILIAYVLINYLVIGVTVPFLGAIVRYKAPFELLLLIVLVQCIPISIWNKMIPGMYRNSTTFVRLFKVKKEAKLNISTVANTN